MIVVPQPNIDIHVYEDRSGRHRARVDLTHLDAVACIRVPGPEAPGFGSRAACLDAVEHALRDFFHRNRAR